MNRGKIVLFFPRTGFDIPGVSVDPPLSLLYLAAFLRDEFEVAIIDQRMEEGENWKGKLRAELDDALCFGVSAMTCPQILYGLEASRIVKEESPATKIVWGGIHPSILPEQTLENPLIDIVVKGEGEIPFLNLCRVLARGGTYLSEHIVDGDSYEKVDLDRCSSLPYGLLKAGMERYIGSQGRFEELGTRSLIMISSRGCVYKCSYCATCKLYRKWRCESPEKTLERTGELIRKYGINAVAYHDEEFAINPRRVRTLAEGFKKEFGGRDKFHWWAQMRMDNLLRLKDTFLLLEESGLESIQPGIESGSDAVLNSIKKGETVQTFLEVNRLLAKTEIKPLYNFMLGFPGETLEQMKETLRLAVRLLKENPKAMVSGVYVAVPYPGTELFERAVKFGFEPPQKLEDWAGFNRQQLLTPWIRNSREISEFIEFAKLTSRMVDAKRLPLRLKHSFGNKINFSSIDFDSLSRKIQKAWTEGDVSDLELFKIINSFALSMFEIARHLNQKFVSCP